MNLDKMTSSVVRIGEGRGFVVQGPFRRLIITAAHCLPGLPPAHPAATANERTCRDILALIGQKPTISAECLFVDPIGDLAILGATDDGWEEYDALLGTIGAVTISNVPEKCSAWLLSLNQRWFECTVTHNGGGLWFSDTAERICGGMSGSPVMLGNGSAIGVICTDHGPNPHLMYHLPGRFLRGDEKLQRARRRDRPRPNLP